MSDLGDIMRRNVLEVFAEADPVRRDAVMAEIYAPGAALIDPEGSTVGLAAISAKVTELQAQGPGLSFCLAGEPRSVADLGIVDWELAPGDGPAVVRGTDIGLFVDGRLTTCYTLLS